MSLKCKIDFINRILESQTVELADRSIDRLINDLFMTKHQDQGMRLTEAGYLLAYKAGITHYEFIIPHKENNLQILLNISHYITAPFFILKSYPLEIHIFDERIPVAIKLQDGIENFIESRKVNQR